MSATLEPVTVTIWGAALGGGDVESVCTTKFMGHTVGFKGRQQDPRESVVWMHDDEDHTQPADSYALGLQGTHSRIGMVTGGSSPVRGSSSLLVGSPAMSSMQSPSWSTTPARLWAQCGRQRRSGSQLSICPAWR